MRHLTRISQNLLFLTRGESGRVTLSFANLDLGRFAADTVRDLAPAAADRQLQLEVSSPPKRRSTSSPTAGRMQQVLHNLIENALQYTEAGRPHPCARRVRAGRGAPVGLATRESGFRADDLPYVFERFFRSKRSRRANPGGSGLGLSIVRWIVEAHKGRVTVESASGKGSTFTVRLPVL